MISKIIQNPLLLTVAVVLSSALAYGQAIGIPVVPAGSVGPDESRPYSWVVVPADSSSTLNLVQAPGQTTCNNSNPCWYTEAQIWTAYGLPPLQSRGHNGQGITIGIVDAFYDPQIGPNLTNFSTFFSLPLGTAASTITCSTTPTFTVVSQTGGSPSGVGFNSGWAEEANLDVQQAHAMAPCANILLIAATNNSNTNLYAGVKYAYSHSDLVTNSWGSNEFGGESGSDANWIGSTVPLLFSAGDTGAITEYPCTSPYITCVGGTHLLTTPTSFRTSESVWNDGATDGATGGGCSSGEAKPTYQTGFTESICGTARGVPDVGGLADEYTGVALALGSQFGGPGVFCCIGGTSLASPLIAGVLANVDGARVTAGKSKLGFNLNALLYSAASYSPTGVSSQPAPYGSSYRSFYFDVFSGNSGFAATTYWDRTVGLGVPSFASIGNYLITTAP